MKKIIISLITLFVAVSSLAQDQTKATKEKEDNSLEVLLSINLYRRQDEIYSSKNQEGLERITEEIQRGSELGKCLSGISAATKLLRAKKVSLNDQTIMVGWQDL
ncbi:MAG: hypothetical protein SGJ18_06675 [Pseudomonadota bacterium]|nr:hypothetical protein [Pseudomonadota bacterium]